MCYSIDMCKKLAFTREIDHIKYSHPNNLSEYEELLITYMQYRIKEIDKEYDGDPSIN